MKTDELILYRNCSEEDRKILHDMVTVCESINAPEKDTGDLRTLFYDSVYRLMALASKCGFYGNIWHCFLAYLLVNDENAYSTGCEITGFIDGSVNDAVLHDMEIFRTFFEYPLEKIARTIGADCANLITKYQNSDTATNIYSPMIRKRICDLARMLAKEGTAASIKDSLTVFYKDVGVGDFGLHKAFRIEGTAEPEKAKIVPVLNTAEVKLSDLVGYEIPKEKLRVNTDAFVAGKCANNVLLYGDAGTGKSTSVKAIANEYYPKGLRIIEIYKHQFRYLLSVIEKLRDRNYKFIIFMDDLSFEEFETDYKYLKAVIEGGLEKRPQNVLIYATSNRRHLVKERFSDRNDADDEKHRSDTVQEKLSLAGRFGETIYFGSPEKKEFQNIVKTLAERNGIRMEENELLLAANAWELSHGGLSGRTAQQFIDHLLSL